MRKMTEMTRMMFAAIGAAALLGVIAGCGASSNSSPAVTADQAPAAKAKYNMAYVVSAEDEYLGQLRDEALSAAKEKGVDLEVFYSGNDVMKMLDCVEAARSKGKDAVLINLHASEEAKACLEAAGDDMKVVFINREPDDPGLLNENAVVVGSDEHQSGKFQGEYLAEYFKGIGQTDVSYVLVEGTDGLVHTTLRTEGVIKAMEDAGLNLEEKAVVEADYDRNTAKEKMSAVLPGLEYDCVISNNDAMAIGTIMAMQDLGVDPSDVPVVGIDAIQAGREQIRSGNMAMTVFQSAKGQAAGGVQAAINMLEGKDLAEGTGCEVSEENPYTLYFPFIPVTAENVDEI